MAKRSDIAQVEAEYRAVYSELEQIAGRLEELLKKNLFGLEHVDRVTCRAKAIQSFLDKSNKTNSDGTLKYPVPSVEIQDMIGARIVVYYKTDVELVHQQVLKYFHPIEEVVKEPDDISKFGYEGFHLICFLPNLIFSAREFPLVGNFFELQIKTLFQHAWSQAEHGLGYKPGARVISEQQRLMAFVAAQSWGADKALVEVVENIG